jgi:hypothetical protein
MGSLNEVLGEQIVSRGLLPPLALYSNACDLFVGHVEGKSM